MNDSITGITGNPREVTTTVPVDVGTGRTPGQGLRTETRVSIRVATHLDGEGLRGMFSRSSAETIHRRFHTPFPQVPEWMLALMLDADRTDKEFLVAVADGKVVGHAMYAMLGGGEAEMAIVVEEGWQSKGVGKALLRELAADAGRRGVQTFVGSVLTDNRPMLGLIGAMFAGSRRAFDDGAYLVRMPLETLEPAAPERNLGRAA
jgi:GNAT superfamily N-acetyltransferase